MINYPSPNHSKRSSSSSEDEHSAKKPNPYCKLQHQESEVVPLEIQKATSKILKNRSKDPRFSQNLRWVRDTKKNREILFHYIINRVLIRKILHGSNWSYMPCCNVFSQNKPTGRGHRGVKYNPLLFLLEEHERSKVLTFKKKLKLKLNSARLSETKFYNLARPQLFAYLKAEIGLKKLSKLIEDLPRKDGCFHLPLMMNKYRDDCPGSCPLAQSEESFDFKVDLVSIEISEIDQKELNQLSASKKQKEKRSGGKYLKRLKIDGELSQVNHLEQFQAGSTLTSAHQVSAPSYSLPQSKIHHHRQGLLESSFPGRRTFQVSPAQLNLVGRRDRASYHQGSRFRNSRSYSPLSPGGQGDPSKPQMTKLLNQVNKLNLEPMPSWFGQSTKKEPNYFFTNNSWTKETSHKLRGEDQICSQQLTHNQKTHMLKQLSLLKEQKLREQFEITEKIEQQEKKIGVREKKIASIEKEIEELIRIIDKQRGLSSECVNLSDSESYGSQ